MNANNSQDDAVRTSGSLIAHFETAEGERTGPQLDIPLDTTAGQLQLIINELLKNDEKVPYSFYIAEDEITSSLQQAIGSASTEQAVRIVYVPQAVFRVRAVTRCTSTLPGHAEVRATASACGASCRVLLAPCSARVLILSRFTFVHAGYTKLQLQPRRPLASHRVGRPHGDRTLFGSPAERWCRLLLVGAEAAGLSRVL